MNSRHIVAVTKVEPPFTNPCVFDVPISKSCDGGINFEIFRIVMSFLGFSFSLIQADAKTSGYEDENGTWHGMAAQLMRGEADMTATLISISTERLAVLDYSVPVSYYMSGFLLKKPTSSDIKANSFKFLASPFSREGWFCLLGAVIVVSLVFTISRYQLNP